MLAALTQWQFTGPWTCPWLAGDCEFHASMSSRCTFEGHPHSFLSMLQLKLAFQPPASSWLNSFLGLPTTASSRATCNLASCCSEQTQDKRIFQLPSCIFLTAFYLTRRCITLILRYWIRWDGYCYQQLVGWHKIKSKSKSKSKLRK